MGNLKVIGNISKKIWETLTFSSNKKLQFRDTGLYIQSDADGSLKLASDGVFKQVGGSSSISGAGAIDVTNDVTLVTSTGANALTLADGAAGQRKLIIMVADSGDATLTPAHLGNGTTITFDDVGDCAELIFVNSAWYMIGGSATLA
jgi:hypothetical protein